MTYLFTARPRYWVVSGGQLVLVDGPPGSNPEGSLTHGRDLTIGDVGPRSTPAGTTYNSRQTISANNTTISGNIYNKGLTVSGNGNTIEDCYIGDDTTSDYANLIVTGEDNVFGYNEIDNQEAVYYCIAQRGGSAANPNIYLRNRIHHGGHGINSDGWNGYQFRENYVHDIVAPDPAPYPGDEVWHADGMIGWGSDITVERNKILCPLAQTGIINIGVWSGSTADTDSVTIDSNYFAGAGYIFYIEEKESPTYHVTNMVITNNDIGQDYYTDGGYYGVWYQGYPPDTPPTVTGNRLVTAGGVYVSDIDYYE